MITEYLLVIQVCGSLLGADCAWLPSAVYETEERCVAHGLGGKFHCIKVERPAEIPLPRPRPMR
jgi:hypothetical protein